MDKWIFYILGSVLLLLSCEQRDEAAVQAVIQERVAANIDLFRERQIRKCHKETMQEAIFMADSLVLAQALAAKDTSQFIRPIKPTKPTVNIPKDDTPIAPLFEEKN